ncbi:MAG: retropepsin-like aspartic protease [bacterium]|nr:retropepsin-like aspartic protease [bacterium]
MANSSTSQATRENRPIVVATAALTFIPNGEKLEFEALVDTGAQATAVTRRVVSRLNTTVTGSGTLVAGVDGATTPIDTLWLRIGVSPLPSKEIRVAVLPWQPDNHDIVLGMDYLADHDFAIRRGVFEFI